MTNDEFVEAVIECLLKLGLHWCVDFIITHAWDEVSEEFNNEIIFTWEQAHPQPEWIDTA